jgi:hypothetical protein
MLPQLQEFIDDGFVTFRAAGRPDYQQTIYRDCMEKHAKDHNWMAFIDLDEFIVLRRYLLPPLQRAASVERLNHAASHTAHACIARFCPPPYAYTIHVHLQRCPWSASLAVLAAGLLA